MYIIGVDPGTTTAVAILDLDGEQIATRSEKEFDQSSINSFIVAHGKPLIIATDVTPAPQFVEKLVSTFGAELYQPDNDLGQDEKEALLQNDEHSFDSHTRDAIAAARKASHAYDDIITKTRDRLHDHDLSLKNVLTPVIHDDRSITQVITEKTTVDEPEMDEDTDTGHSVDWKEKAKEYRKEVKEKEKEVERLRSYVNTLKDDISSLEKERDQLEENCRKEIMTKDLVQKWKQRAEDYKKQLDEKKNANKTLKNTIDRFEMALDFINRGETVLRIRDSEELVTDASGPIMIVGAHVQAKPPEPVKVVITTTKDDHAFYDQYGVTVLHYADLRGLKLDSYYIIDDESVLDAIDTDSKTFMDWLESYRDRE